MAASDTTPKTKIHPTAQEVARLGELAHAPPATSSAELGFMSVLGDEANGRMATVMPECIDIELSPEELGGGVPITSVTRVWLNSNKTEDGMRVPSKSIIVWCHGAGHHARDSSVFRLGSELSARGHTVAVFDAEGNGCSSGLHGLCTSFDRWSVQAAEAAKFAQKRLREEAGGSGGADCPAFLMGESMGGALSINTVLEQPDIWAGMILIAPMCAISPELMPSWPVVQALRCMAVCCPGWAVVPMQDHLPNCFRNSHSFILEKARSDPLRYAGVNRLGTGLQSLNVMDKIFEQAADVKVPLLVMHGSADVVTDPHTSLRFWESTRSEDKTYVSFKDAWHVMWFDNYDNRVMALDMIDEWVSQRSSPSVESAGASAAGKSSGSLEPLRPAARILEASGSCMSELMGETEVPVPPGGPEQCFWAVDPASVEGELTAAADDEAAAAPRLTLRLREGPALPRAWADAPMRCKFPDAATLAELAAASAVEDADTAPIADRASEPEGTSASA